MDLSFSLIQDYIQCTDQDVAAFDLDAPTSLSQPAMEEAMKLSLRLEAGVVPDNGLVMMATLESQMIRMMQDTHRELDSAFFEDNRRHLCSRIRILHQMRCVFSDFVIARLAMS